MYRINPLLESDFYKQVHWNQYPKDITKVVSYFVPRMSRLKHDKHLIMFGLQSFIKEYLIEDFNEFFFSRSKKTLYANISIFSTIHSARGCTVLSALPSCTT